MSQRMTEQPTVRFVKMFPDVVVPEFQSEGASGADLHACDERLRDGRMMALLPGDTVIVGTGVKIAVPPGYEGQVRPRNGLAAKHGVTVVNSPGTIDSDYRDIVSVILHRLRESVADDKDMEHFFVSWGDRIAQLVICPVTRPAFEVVKSLDETERGEGGFGSTGVDTVPEPDIKEKVVPALHWAYGELEPALRKRLLTLEDGPNRALTNAIGLQAESEWNVPHGYSTPQVLTISEAFDALYPPEKEEDA